MSRNTVNGISSYGSNGNNQSFPLEIGASSLERDPRYSRLQQQSSDTFGSRFVFFCSIVSIATVVIISLDLLLQILCFVLVTQFSTTRDGYLFIYRLYGIAFATLALFCEMEWTEIVRSTSLLQYWSTRGAFYIFLALFTLQEYAEIIWARSTHLQIFVNIVSVALLMVGLMYTCMGIACSRQIRDQKMARYIQMLTLYENSSYGDSIGNVVTRPSHVQSGAFEYESYHSVR